jgi:hypothetical protein
MPGDTDRGWSRLTPSYQRTRARGRSSYEGFWNDIDRVSVSRVSGDPPNRAVATIRYVYKSGRVVRETTSFQLVKRGGELKINRSTVLSTA